MKCEQIIEVIESTYRKNHAMDWDNVGLLVGDKDAEVNRILLALDATEDVIEQAVASGANLIITHHPLIFKGMKRITTGDFIGRRVMKLISHGISYYAMHTNFDVGSMGMEAGERLGICDKKILEVTGEEAGNVLGIGIVGKLSKAQTVLELAEQVKQEFELENVRIYGDKMHMVNRVAVVPGSGGRDISEAISAGAQVLVTGDIDHHEGLDAVACGLTIIDAGHYGLEHIFAEYMEGFLNEKLNGAVELIRAKENAPFEVV